MRYDALASSSLSPLRSLGLDGLGGGGLLADGAERDLDLALLDLARQAVELGALELLVAAPGGDARVEDDVHLLERLALGFGGGEEHVDEGSAVERSEDHVPVKTHPLDCGEVLWGKRGNSHLPVDGPEKRGNGEGEGAVPGPVGGG